MTAMRLARTLGVAVIVVALGAACTGGQEPAPALSASVSWQHLPDAPAARTEVVAAVIGKLAYVMGGYRGDGSAKGL